jgi:hypothetical protein
MKPCVPTIRRALSSQAASLTFYFFPEKDRNLEVGEVRGDKAKG